MRTIAITVPVTKEALEDAAPLREGLAVAIAGDRPQGERYHAVWRRGYAAALEDIRAGRLELRDGWFDFGPNALTGR